MYLKYVYWEKQMTQDWGSQTLLYLLAKLSVKKSLSPYTHQSSTHDLWWAQTLETPELMRRLWDAFAFH